jgi:hypothetical protein
MHTSIYFKLILINIFLSVEPRRLSVYTLFKNPALLMLIKISILGESTIADVSIFQYFNLRIVYEKMCYMPRGNGFGLVSLKLVYIKNLYLIACAFNN